MTDVAFIALTAYIGICIGTFINMYKYRTSPLLLLMISILFPIPICFLLIVTGISIIRDKETVKSKRMAILVIPFCLMMYADAVDMLGEALAHGKRHSERHQIPFMRNFHFRMRHRVSDDLMTV